MRLYRAMGKDGSGWVRRDMSIMLYSLPVYIHYGFMLMSRCKLKTVRFTSLTNSDNPSSLSISRCQIAPISTSFNMYQPVPQERIKKTKQIKITKKNPPSPPKKKPKQIRRTISFSPTWMEFDKRSASRGYQPVEDDLNGKYSPNGGGWCRVQNSTGYQ